MAVTASDATFNTPEFGRGLKATWLAVSSYDPDAGVFPGVELPTSMPLTIMSPRPASERTGRLHTPWDKWLTGTAWGGKAGMHVAVKYGVFPYRLEVSGDLTSNDFTIDHDLMTITKTFTAAGTYALKLTVVDAVSTYTSVDISLVVHASDAGDITTNFRVIDFDAGSNGTGTLASPYNTWSSFWGTDWNTVIDPTIIALMDGTATVSSLTLSNEPNSEVWSLGTNRPRCLIGMAGSDVTFDISAGAAAKRLNCHTAGDNDLWLKGFTLSGVRSADTSMIRQEQFGSRTHWHDLTFKDASITDSGGVNTGCIGNDGETYTKRWSSIMGCTFDNITGANLSDNSSLVTLFTVEDFLIADNVLTNIGTGGNRPGNGIRIKHQWRRSEIRGNTHIQLGYDPIAGNRGSIVTITGSGVNHTYTDTVIRHNCIMHSGEAFFWNQETPAIYTNFFILNNTFRGAMIAGTATSASTCYIARNITENGQASPGFGTIDADFTAADGHAATAEDNLHGASGTLIDSSGIPLLSANNGYGHSIAYLTA